MGINPYARYQKVQVETADQGKLLLMLYTGALRFLGLAKKALQEGNLENVNHNLLRSEDIIAELMSALNHEAGAMAGGLFQLYDYIHYLLVQGNIKKEIHFLEQAEELLNELLDVWKEVLGGNGRTAVQSRAGRTGPVDPGKFIEEQIKDMPSGYEPAGPGGKGTALETGANKRLNVSG